jgi:hypothetical protein
MPEVPGEPKGWRDLQERAQQETDPKKLAAIIDEMNKLLTEHEGRAGGDLPRRAPDSVGAPKLKLRSQQRLQ